MNKWQLILRNLTNAGFSQQEIASLIGCSQAQVNFMIHGARGKRLSFDIAQKLVAIDEKLQRNEISPVNKAA